MVTHSSILAWRILRRSLAGYNPWDLKGLDTTEKLSLTQAARRTTERPLMKKKIRIPMWCVHQVGAWSEECGWVWGALGCLDLMAERSPGQSALFPRVEGKEHLCEGTRDTTCVIWTTDTARLDCVL